MTYEKTVAAAVAETKSKFALAEALALDIPPRRPGTSDDATIAEYLVEARQAIIDAGGEPKSTSSLRDYRQAALWVIDRDSGQFRWVAGVSYSAHYEAYKAGLSYEEFAANPQTIRELRQGSGRPSKDGPPASVIPSWTPEQKAEAARQLLADAEVAEQVEKEITDYVASDHKRTADVVSKRRKSMPEPVPEHDEPTRPKRDYDALIEQHVNGLSVALAAESSKEFAPSERSEALLYFLAQILGNRREPTGDQADFVNEKLDSLFSEVEAYANAEVG